MPGQAVSPGTIPHLCRRVAGHPQGSGLAEQSPGISGGPQCPQSHRQGAGMELGTVLLPLPPPKSPQPEHWLNAGPASQPGLFSSSLAKSS